MNLFTAPPLSLLPPGAQIRRGAFAAREGQLSLVVVDGRTFVLRETSLSNEAAAQDWANNVAWLHRYIARIPHTGFVAPRPEPLLDGVTWGLFAGSGFEVLTFVQGSAVGWDTTIPMEQVGSLLAHLHHSSSQMSIPQRPTCFPVGRLRQLLAHMQARCDLSFRNELDRMLAELDEDLARVGHDGFERFVIHGDFTNHNVITRPRPYGVIDFALAYVESFLCDIAFALWRSGRPFQESPHLDLGRTASFVAGYTRLRRMPDGAASALPVYVRARGLQMMVKSVIAGSPTTAPLDEVRWLREHSAELEGVIADALETSVPD